MDQELFIQILKLVCIPCLFVALAIPFIKSLAEHVGALDIPNARKVHLKPIPRMGGLGIYFGFLLGYMLFGAQNAIMNSILIGSFIIVLIGVVDDIKPLKASYKFVGQLVAAMIVVFYGGILLKEISAFGLYLNFGLAAYPITIFFILGCINCMNFIDGLDGLASGISAIFFLAIGIIAVCKGQTTLAFTLTFIMFGSCIGFLIHNFHPASIFMGDSGSMFLGFIISVITLLGYKNVMMSSIVIPLLILAIPISDTLFAILRRKLKGESISTPDKLHIHHQLLNRNLGQRGTVLIIYLATILFASASMIYVLKDAELGYIIYGILLFILMVFALKTDIIISHTNNKKEEPKEEKIVKEKNKKSNTIKKNKNNGVKTKKEK
jgi:UDP-N-acetylmuramyl pentapeptide phosphotransferase/UDP-N-acetylglucosamine-1-phosphate transferase